jgi:hypothetical protein
MFSRGGRSFNRFTTECGSARGQTRLNSGGPQNPVDPKIKTNSSGFDKVLNRKNKNLSSASHTLQFLSIVSFAQSQDMVAPLRAVRDPSSLNPLHRIPLTQPRVSRH